MSKQSVTTSPPFALDKPEQFQARQHNGGKRHQAVAKSSTDDLNGPPNSKKFFSERRKQVPLIRPQTGCPGFQPDSKRFNTKSDAEESGRRAEEQRMHMAALKLRSQNRAQHEQQLNQKERALQARADQQIASKARAMAAREAARNDQQGFNIINLQAKPAKLP